MISRKDLKKGDHVLEVATFNYSNQEINNNYTTELVVVSIGSKYIGCQAISSDGELYGNIKKFNNDECMCQKDWSQFKLFLGTREEYKQEIENQKKCADLYHEINQKFHRELGYEKLMAIKAIIESDDLNRTLLELSPVKPACACA